jgi:hypothetical protein
MTWENGQPDTVIGFLTFSGVFLAGFSRKYHGILLPKSSTWLVDMHGANTATLDIIASSADIILYMHNFISTSASN